MNKVISVEEDSAIDVLVEEISHFAIESMGESNLLDRVLDLVEGTQEYKDNYDAYMKEYKSVKKVKKEVLGKLLRDELMKEKEMRGKSPIVRLLLRIWAKFKGIVAGSELSVFLAKHSQDILDGKLDAYSMQNLNNSEDYYSLIDVNNKDVKKDTKKYDKLTKSKILASYKKTLEDMIRNLDDRIKIYKSKYSSGVLSDKLSLMDSLLEALADNNENRITEGILNFILDAEKSITDVNSRIENLYNNAHSMDDVIMSTELRKITDFVESYGKITTTLIADITLAKKENITPFNKKVLKETLESLNNINNTIGAVAHVKNNIQYDIIGSKLYEFIGDNAKNLTKEDLIKVLRESKDINWYTAKLNAMNNSTDEGLRLFDQWTKRLLRKAKMSYDDEYIPLMKITAKHNIKDFKPLYEKNEKNKLTGYLISPFMIDKFNKAKTKFFKELNTKYKLTGDRFGDSAIKANWTALKRNQYDSDKKEWYVKNEEKADNVQALIIKKMELILKNVAEDYNNPTKEEVKEATKQHNAWQDANTTIHEGSNSIFYNGSLSQPKKELYGNKKFDSDLSSKPGLREFYNAVIESKNKLDNYFPENFTDLYLAPQILRDGRERLTSSDNKIKQAITNTKEGFKVSVDDKERGVNDFVDSNDVVHKFLPVFYTKKVSNDIDEMDANLSTDLLGGMSAYIDMAERYRVASRNEDLLKLTIDIYEQRRIVDNSGIMSKGLTSVTNALGERRAASSSNTSSKGGRAAVHLKEYIDTLFYRKLKVDEGTLFNTNLDKGKLADMLNKYTALKGLSLNVHSSIANVTLGNSLIAQEAVAKEFFSIKDLAYADATYIKELPKAMADLGNVEIKSYMNLFAEHFEIFQDHHERVGSQNANRTKFGRMLSTSALFFMQGAGEHQMQMRTALAIANKKKVYLKGSEISLFKAYEDKKGKLTLKEGVTQDKEGKVPVDSDFEFKYLSQVQRLNQKLHGIYNLNDRAALQRYAAGRIVLMFSKYLVPSINRRYGKKKFDYMLDTEAEGMYNTFNKFMWNIAKDLTKMQFNAKTHWKDLSNSQKANVVRTTTEMSQMLALLVLIGFISDMGDDDEEKSWAWNMMALQTNRLFTELSAYQFPTIFSEGIKKTKNPAPGVGVLGDITKILTDSFSFGNLFKSDKPFLLEYNSGRNKGDSHLEQNIYNLIPVVKNIKSANNPQDMLRFY